MEKNNKSLFDDLRSFKRKYYVNELIKGSIFLIAALLSIYVLATSVEFNFQLGIGGRTTIFFSFLALFIIGFYRWVVTPCLKLFVDKYKLTDEAAAKQIGDYFPDVKDKLLNTIQLSSLSADQNSLIQASLRKRGEELKLYKFTQSIDLGQNKRYAKYVLWPSIIIVCILLFVPNFFTESTKRIVNFNEEFETIKLFSFMTTTEEFVAFKNEDFSIDFEISGRVTPEKVYVVSRGRKIRIYPENGKINHTFPKVQDNFDFKFEAAGQSSKTYNVTVYQRPDIKNFNVNLDYPNYTGLQNESLSNIGNFKIPEGTNVEWLIKTIASEEVRFNFEEKQFGSELIDNQLFKFKKRILKSEEYQLQLNNEYSANKDSISYSISVIPDEHPNLSLNVYQDTTLFAFTLLSGQVSDDYGLTNLELMFKSSNDNDFRRRSIPISRSLKDQNFFYQWSIDSLELRQGEEVEYFVRVWDNDAINGRKFTKSGTYKIKVPSKEEIKEDIAKQSSTAKDQLDKSLEEAKDLNEQIEEIQNEIKSKQRLDWQDNKRIQDLVNQKQKLKEELEKLTEENRALAEKRKKFNQPNERLQKKVEQLQKLMEDILDEETKALYEELQKLLQEQSDVEQIEDVMNQIENKEENLEKEIERALELFKKMQFDFKMEEIINELDEMQEKQSELANETKDKDNSFEELGEEQEKLNEDFKNLEEDFNELNELNDKLKNPEDIDNMEQDQQDIQQEQQQSQENLENKKRKKAADSQQKASDKMKKMKEKMEQMQAGMEMQMLQENLDNLRDIVDNLVKISFDQEKIMTDFRGVNQSDPRYVTLSQKQLKLKDDAKIIEDSLLSLASRVFQIASFVTRELDAMNDNIEASLEALRDRRRSEAVSNQQYAMTSINNLALLLDDVLQQMQQQMADAMGNPQSGNKGQKQQMPGLSELQQQLNKQIEDLKKSGKSGRQLSQELAELAAQQEMLRQRLQEMEEKLGQFGEDGEEGLGDNLSEAIKKMEQTELDLVNKNITQRTLQRQKDILTRLLKAENAMRERELDDEREAEQALEYQRNYPPGFEEFLKAKEKETDLLKTIPVKLNPYYKEEVNKYFRRLSEQ